MIEQTINYVISNIIIEIDRTRMNNCEEIVLTIPL